MERWLLLGLWACACGGDAARPGTDDHAPGDSSSATATTSASDGASDDDPTDDASTTATATTAALDDSSGSGGLDGPPTIARIGDTFAIPTLDATAPKRFADAAHDPESDAYLVVNGNGAISGSFVAADGASLGSPFAIADTQAWTQGVRVAWGGDAFLVAWHDNRDDPNAARLRGRIVRWNGSAPALGPDVEIGTGTTYSEMPPAIAWSQSSGVYLVAWHTAVADDIHAQRVAPDGTKVGGEIVVTADPDWQSDAGLAWNPWRDEWLAVYTHAGVTTEVRARRIAADGSLPAAETSLGQAAGTWLAHAAFVPEDGEYVVAWFQGEIAMQRVDEDGVPVGELVVLAPGYGNYDGFAMARSPVTGTFAAVFHGTTDEDFAAAFAADGTQSEVIEATSSRGADGHFNPHVTAHSTRPEWLLVTSLGFATVVGQRLGP